MDMDTLWHAFAHSGRIEDYLRYRGVDLPVQTTNRAQEEELYDHRIKTASDDRRADTAGI